MRSLGLGALTHANMHCGLHSWGNEHWPSLSVLQAAHAAEILIKSKIADEHPLLIFDEIPSARSSNGDLLGMDLLLAKGKTLPYSKLVDRLWATTGYRIPNEVLFREFGFLRNRIQHFATEGDQQAKKTREFVAGVIDPLIHDWWGLCALDFHEDCTHEYLIPIFLGDGILFNVSECMAGDFDAMDIDWPENRPDYRSEMERRFSEALKG